MPRRADIGADETYDVAGKIVMAGAIDIHSHIAGNNVNTARLLLPEFHRDAGMRQEQTPLANAAWGTFQTGCLYAAMGFTTVVEPAVAPQDALHAHLELADIPIIDKATLSVLGNDDYLLRPDARERKRIGCSRLCGLDARDLARARHQGDQCRRCRRFQIQCAAIFIR